MVTPTVAIVGSNMMDLITYYRDRMPKTGKLFLEKTLRLALEEKEPTRE